MFMKNKSFEYTHQILVGNDIEPLSILEIIIMKIIISFTYVAYD